MADTYTFKIKSTCAGGGHITIDILKNGDWYKEATYSREQIQTGEFQKMENISSYLIAKILKSAGTKTDDEHISAIEKAEVIL